MVFTSHTSTHTIHIARVLRVFLEGRTLIVRSHEGQTALAIEGKTITGKKKDRLRLSNEQQPQIMTRHRSKDGNKSKYSS